MELKDVKTILKRIEVNYQSFTNDAYAQSEWYKELKEYDLEDVMQKLEEHFRNETYGNQIPKVYFLTKYLKTTKDKGKIENHFLCCPICNGWVKGELFDEHYARCNSVRYVIKQTKKHLDKDLKREVLMNMPEDEFQEKYNKLLKIIQRGTSEEREEQLIGFIFDPPKQVNIEEVI